MFYLLLLISFSVSADIDLSAIKELDDELPNYQHFDSSEVDVDPLRQSRGFRPPERKVSFQEIKESGVQYGAVRPDSPIYNMDTGKSYLVEKLLYVKHFKLEDEHGFKYLIEKDGSIVWKIDRSSVEPIKEELVLYEPPHRYTPAPPLLIKADYDKKLVIPPAVSFYAGIAQGDFMRDLLDGTKIESGTSNQYGVHFATQWDLPVKVGGALHFERASYALENGGRIIYSSPSIGPLLKSGEFSFLGHPLRFQVQFRVSPFANASIRTSGGENTFKFNSADLLASFERPIRNYLGEFVIGLYFQNQWLNIREQSQLINVEASNETNKSFGLYLSQVFE